jgi:superfamily II DNA or RNA helicase
VCWVNAGGHPDLVRGWGWKQWPGRAKAGLPRIERGVDLIAEDHAGRLVAIQAKFRNDPDSPVKTGEVQKFVGAYRKHFPRRMLISNASSRARGIKEAVGDAEAELVLRTDLMESLFDWVAAKPLPRPKVTPLPFQKEAAAAIKRHLKDGGRAQIVMACGSGKTYTTLLAMEALGSKRVLVLAPTLLLVKQLRDEWMRERTNAWATLAVCSDIGTDEGDDSTQLSPGEIGAKPTTDPVEIAEFLKSKGPYVVFGTYASSARIATAQKEAGVPAFDLVVADEAHRIAGAVGKADNGERAQRVVLDENGIRAERRLFATATPRVYGGDKKRDGEEVVLESMDDPTRFGEEVYKLTFQQAVDLERLVPYKLLVTIVTNEEIAALIRDRKYVDVQGKQITADDLATAIAVRRAYKELGISRAISYHGSIKRARAFAQLVQEINVPGKAPEAECVTGAMPVEDRKEALTRLAQADGPYLITNARCLTEGIDVPALDAVVFADPRRSQVDIVQAVGRAMRKPRGTSSKTTGYIILPVFLSKNDLKDPETAVEGSAFAPVLQVLRALKAHDPYRATFFAKILAEEGKRPHKKGEGIDEILEVSIGKELDRALTERLERAVQLRAVEVSADVIDVGILVLSQYVLHGGDISTLSRTLTFQGVNLGRMAMNIRRRYREGNLRVDQIQRLELLANWSWDAQYERNMLGLEALQKYKAREGHVLVPALWVEGEIRLGRWVNHLRTGALSIDEELRKQLDAIGFVWAVPDHVFEMKLKHLVAYINREGHAQVPKNHLEGSFPLGAWVGQIRSRKARLSPERIAALNKIGFIWEPAQQTYIDKLSLLKRYREREGHVAVPSQWIEDGVKLGNWVNGLRTQRKQGTLTQVKYLELSELGFVWSPADIAFENFVTALKVFIDREGHGHVPARWSEGGIAIGPWLARITKDPNRLSDTQRLIIKKAGLDVLTAVPAKAVEREKRDVIGKQKMINLLKEFYLLNGHTTVSRSSSSGTRKLGNWINNVRANRIVLSPSEREELGQIGFIWHPKEYENEQGLEALREYAEREGHVRVPQQWEEHGFSLGRWLKRVRSSGNQLTQAQWDALTLLGVSRMVSRSESFEQKLQALRSFRHRVGHARVPGAWIEHGVPLGVWCNHVRSGNIKLNPTEKQALDDLDFAWTAFAKSSTDTNIAAYEAYVAREKKTYVPPTWKEGAINLGQWYRNVRQGYIKLTEEQRDRLTKLGFAWKES